MTLEELDAPDVHLIETKRKMDDNECPELVIEEDTKDSDKEYSSEGGDDKKEEKNDDNGDDGDDDDDSSNGEERQTAGKWVCRQEIPYTCKLN